MSSDTSACQGWNTVGEQTDSDYLDCLENGIDILISNTFSFLKAFYFVLMMLFTC